MPAQPAKRLLHTNADIEQIKHIFQHWANDPIWINWSEEPNKDPNKKPRKKPAVALDKPQLFKPLSELKDSDKIGITFHENNPHTLIAIDNDGLNPAKCANLKALLERHPTYTEASPSGLPYRERIIYAVIVPDEKEKLAYISTKKYANLNAEISLYSRGNRYVTVTGLNSNNLPIAIISPEDLLEQFPEFKAKAHETTKPQLELVAPTRGLREGDAKPSNTKFEVWVKTVPLNRNHPRVQMYMQEHQINYYDYWLRGCMALRYFGGANLGIHLAHAWCKTVPEEYDADELDSKWPTLTEDPNMAHISTGTYEYMFNYFSIQWPVKSSQGAPIHDEFLNFSEVLKFQGIEVKVDAVTRGIYLSGPDSVLYPHFYKDKKHMYSIDDLDFDRLCYRLLTNVREYKLRPSLTKVKDHLKVLASEDLSERSRFADEVALHSWNPDTDIDYIEYITDHILTRHPKDDPDIFRTLTRKWLLSLGRNLWRDEMPHRHKDQTAEGILILSSREGGIGKSNFASKIFPKEWEHLHTQVKPRISGANEDKDYKMKTVGALIVDFDEAERIFDSNKAGDLRSTLTAKFIKVRFPYETAPRKYRVNHSYYASTNMDKMQLSRAGYRRYWWLNVLKIDLDGMDKMDRYKLWAQIRYLILNADTSKPAPWLLSDSERKSIEALAGDHTSENSLELDLLELYDFSPESFEERIATTLDQYQASINNSPAKAMTAALKDIRADLPQYSTALLKNTLTDLLRRKAPESVAVGNVNIEHGVITIRGARRFLMPMKRTDF